MFTGEHASGVIGPLKAALLSQELNDFKRISVVLAEGSETQPHRFPMSDLMAISHNTVNRFSKLTTGIAFEPLFPFLTKACGKLQD